MNKMNLVKKFLIVGIVFAVSLFVTSCNNDNDTPAAPTIKIKVNSIDGFKVDIAAQASNDVIKWHWDYGDGNTSDSVGGHYYTYTKEGDFTIKCTVTNEQGVSASAETAVHIAGFSDLLTAHPWVMSNSGNNGLGFHITSDLSIDFPVTDVLSTLNSFENTDDLEYDFTAEYDDVYTFNSDGTFNIDYGANNNVLSSWVYAGHEEFDNIIGTCKYVGIYAIHESQPFPGDKWKMHVNETLTLQTVYDPDQTGTGDDGVLETVKFENINYVTFDGQGFIGLKDYTPLFIIRNITEDKMEVSVFFHGFYDEINGEFVGEDRPSFLLNFTFVKPVN